MNSVKVTEKTTKGARMKAEVEVEGFGWIQAEIAPTELKGRRGFCCMVKIQGEVFSTILFANGFAHSHLAHKPDWEMLKRISGLGLEILETIVKAIKEKELKVNREKKQRDFLKKTFKASRN